ncbi:uncharacterized protein LOC129598405 [Paramacrobiotus metropolitanus]|uniref:uncharacterized protein LOC129598405 n=1 Tax=Paramacrobiotus metropolitanus TaxID=2943436 RepID=UPI0024458164|nr:uncharacterized protein LOC129598405 [Paramacrobiotus metropolitanus]
MPSGMNVVQVLSSDQRMRHGRVVGVAVDGLFVDRLCANRRHEFVPFGSVFFPSPMKHNEQDSLYDKKWLSGPVEVLVPETPWGPWIWLPGEISCVPKLHGAAVVNWRGLRKGEHCTDIIPIHRIRPLRTASNHAILRIAISPGTFNKGCVDLGEEFRWVLPEKAKELVQRLNGCDLHLLSRIVVVDLVDGLLQYIYVLSKWFSRLCFEETTERLHADILCLIRKFQAEAARSEDGLGTALSMELWQEVFSYFDAVAQTKLRAVCTSWNQIVETPLLRSTIVIRNDDKTNWNAGNFARVASLYKFLRRGTQRVLLTRLDRLSWTQYLREVSAMIQHVVNQRTGIRLRAVYLHRVCLHLLINRGPDAVDTQTIGQCARHLCDPVLPNPFRVDPEYTASSWLEDFLAGCRSLPCDTIHLVDCVVSCGLVIRFPAGQTHFNHTIEFRISSARFRPGSADFGCALWDAMEAGLPVPSAEKLQKLLQRMTMGRKPDDMEAAQNSLSKILCALQSADPRPSAPYRGKAWCVDEFVNFSEFVNFIGTIRLRIE